MTRATVVIPTYNEADNIRPLADTILALPHGLSLLVVDDNSPDGTGGIADELAAASDRVQVIHRAHKEGIGPAYIAGFRHALASGADAVLQMDADLSHDPADLPRLLGTVESDCALAIGSRYCGGVRVLDWSVKRLALSLAASAYVRLLLRMPVTDPTGGFKCWRREALESLDLERIASRGYSFQIEMNYRAWRRGFTVKEVPIVFHERRRGGSKMAGGIVLEALYVLWRIRLQARYDRKVTFHPWPAPAAASVERTP